MSGIERRRTASSFDDRARQMGPTFWKIASAGRGEEPASPIDVYVGVAVMDLGAENSHERP